MSVVGEIGLAIGVVAVVAQVVSAYRDGGSIIDRIKENRAAKRERPLPRQLEDTVRETPEDIERERNKGLRRFGQAFEQGDYIAILTIQQITIQIQTSFLAKLRNAYDDTTDLTALVNDADMGRDGTLRALIELQQRLMTAAPLSNLPQLIQTQSQPYPQPGHLHFGTSQFLEPAPTTIPTRSFLENSQRNDTFTETEPATTRHSGFHLFHRNKRQSQSRNTSQDQSRELDQNEFRRIYTMPSDSSSADIDTPLERAAAMHHLDSPAPPHNTLAIQSTTGASGYSTYSYESWEDDPAEIWGSPRSPRPSTQLPHISPELSAPLRNTTSRSNSSTNSTQFTHFSAELSAPSRTTTSRSNSSTNSIPHPNPSNNYLGFCKGAWKLQDGDRKAMVKSADYTQSAQSKRKFLRCSKCEFEGHFNPDTIWNTIFKFETMKIRWSFLAKSHVQQRSLQNRDLARKCDFTYLCIFCVFLGHQQAAMHGAKAYRDHIAMYHYGTELSELVLYKAGCVNDRICEDSEEFDINLYPKISELS